MVTRFEVWMFPDGVGKDKPFTVCGLLGDEPDMDGPVWYATEDEARTVKAHFEETSPGHYAVIKVSCKILAEVDSDAESLYCEHCKGHYHREDGHSCMEGRSR